MQPPGTDTKWRHRSDTGDYDTTLLAQGDLLTDC
jgi:hypothetical protein